MIRVRVAKSGQISLRLVIIRFCQPGIMFSLILCKGRKKGKAIHVTVESLWKGVSLGQIWRKEHTRDPLISERHSNMHKVDLN